MAHLSAHVVRHGLAAVVPAEFDSPVTGRGVRIRADTPSPSLLIPVVNIPNSVGRVWKTAQGHARLLPQTANPRSHGARAPRSRPRRSLKS